MDAETERALADVEWKLACAEGEVTRLTWWRSELLARAAAEGAATPAR